MNYKKRIILVLIICLIILSWTLLFGYFMYQNKMKEFADNYNANTKNAPESDTKEGQAKVYTTKVGSYTIEQRYNELTEDKWDYIYTIKDKNENIVYNGTNLNLRDVYEYNDSLYNYDTEEKDNVFKIIINKLNNGKFE